MKEVSHSFSVPGWQLNMPRHQVLPRGHVLFLLYARVFLPSFRTRFCYVPFILMLFVIQMGVHDAVGALSMLFSLQHCPWCSLSRVPLHCCSCSFSCSCSYCCKRSTPSKIQLTMPADKIKGRIYDLLSNSASDTTINDIQR